MSHFFLRLLLITITLTSCNGLRPLYAKDKELLSKIEVVVEESVIDAEIYHNLVQLVGRGENSEYLLKIKTISTVVSPLAITGRADVVKQNITNLYSYILIRKSDGETLAYGKIRAVGAYDALSNPYATYTNERFALKNLSQTVAQDIYMRIVLYFSSAKRF